MTADSLRERFALRSEKEDTKRLTDRFIGKGQLAVLAVGILVLLVLLFPRGMINRQLAIGGKPDATSIAYLQLLLRAQPDDPSLRRQLGHAQLQVGQLRAAQATLAPLIRSTDAHAVGINLWLQLRQEQLHATRPGSAARAQARSVYASDLAALTGRLAPRSQLAAIREANAAGLHETAARLAGQLLARPDVSAAHATTSAHSSPTNRNPRTPTATLLHLPGLIWSSGLISRPARKTTTSGHADLATQTFRLLIDSHLAADHPGAALEAAQKNIGKLNPGQVDWRGMIRLAGMADRPAAGAAFAQRWFGTAQDQTDRRAAFHALVNSWLAAGQPAQALAAAQAHLDSMPPSPALWRFMTRLAMQAGDAPASVRYARRLVHIGDGHGH